MFVEFGAPRGETTGYASWYATLWLEEQVTLRAFRSLLSLRRFFGVAENETIEALLENSGADLWVVQKDTLGPYAEPSSLNEDTERPIRAMAGVDRAAGVTYLTMQIAHGDKDVRVMVVGAEMGEPGLPGQPTHLISGRQIVRGHYEAVADVKTGFAIGDRVKVRRNFYTVVGLTSRMVSSGGDPMLFLTLKDAQAAQFQRDSDAIVRQRARTAANPQLNPPGNPAVSQAVAAVPTAIKTALLLSRPLKLGCTKVNQKPAIAISAPSARTGSRGGLAPAKRRVPSQNQPADSTTSVLPITKGSSGCAMPWVMFIARPSEPQIPP